jgi:hypothetical protein
LKTGSASNPDPGERDAAPFQMPRFLMPVRIIE